MLSMILNHWVYQSFRLSFPIILYGFMLTQMSCNVAEKCFSCPLSQFSFLAFFLVCLNSTSHFAQGLTHLTVEPLLVDCCFRPITSLFLHLECYSVWDYLCVTCKTNTEHKDKGKYKTMIKNLYESPNYVWVTKQKQRLKRQKAMCNVR